MNRDKKQALQKRSANSGARNNRAVEEENETYIKDKEMQQAVFLYYLDDN